MRGIHTLNDRYMHRRLNQAACNPRRRRALLNSFALALMGHVLPWCDPNNRHLAPAALTRAYYNHIGMVRAARHLPTIRTTESELRLAISGSGAPRRSARSSLSTAIRHAFGLV
jgi:hypothetical protein